MARTLILGGTAWLGRELAARLIASGNEVTCLARGASGSVPSGAQLVQADRNDLAAYDGVSQQSWDDVIELSYDQKFVSEALNALASQASHWTLVSSVSVYTSNDEPNADETAAIAEPTDLSDYAHAKVAAERTTAAMVGGRLLIARPGLIVGAGDPTDRFGYWVGRFAFAGSGWVLSPQTKDRKVQVVDVRDLASWIVLAGQEESTGTINVVGNPHGMREFLEQAAAIAGYTGRIVEASDAWLLENDVNFWAGPRSLPLWLPEADSNFSTRSNAAYRAAGGTLRPIEETLTDVLEDERSRGLHRERRSGLNREDELELLSGLSTQK